VPGSPENLLSNGYFGANTSGWAFNPFTEGQWTRVQDYGHTTAGCLRVDTNDSHGETITSTDHIAVQAGEQYEISCWIRQFDMESNGVLTAIQLILVTNQGTVILDSCPAAMGNESWKSLSATYTVPVGVTQIDVRLHTTNDVTDGYMYWDDVEVIQTSWLPAEEP
jgi:hypothetical protein